MGTKDKIQFMAVTIFFLASLLVKMIAHADETQALNPQYVEARDLWQKISASSMSASEKGHYGKRFGDLAQEQQELWSLAGQVDRGECKDTCFDSYNSKVEAWQSKLKVFSSDANKAMESYSPPEAGKWTPFGNFTSLNIACFQTWACVPKKDIMHSAETKIVSTPRKTVKGMCQATESVTSCGTCTATSAPPADICEWHLEPRA